VHIPSCQIIIATAGFISISRTTGSNPLRWTTGRLDQTQTTIYSPDILLLLHVVLLLQQQ
jgi:hypothetical protein